MDKQPQQIKIDISNIPNLKCPAILEDGTVCGSEIFVPCAYIKIVSKIQSPTGEEKVVNVQDYMCDECGKTLNEIMQERKLSH